MKDGFEIKLSLQNLDCANCANKIEDRVNKLEGVTEANLNFSIGALSIKISNETQKQVILNEVKAIIKKLEPHVIVEEKQAVASVQTRESHCSDGCCSQGGDHSHDHTHEESHAKQAQTLENEGSKFDKMQNFIKKNIGLLLGIIVFITTMILNVDPKLEVILYLISYILVGKDVLMTAVKNCLRGEVFDENFLMAIATVGAFAIGEFPEAIAVMVFYEIGELFQSYAVNHSRKSISGLLDIRAEFANLVTDKGIKQVAPEQVMIDEMIVVKPGERVPLDGVVVEGSGYLDTSALTGESVPRLVVVGEDILAGCLNSNALLKVRVVKRYEDSTVARILELVENASSKKAKTEKFMTKVAKVYTPIVVGLAVLIAVVPTLVLGDPFSMWLYRALIFLVVSCPCAIVVSIPLAFFAGLGGASKKGILIKGGNYLEALTKVDTVVFDKTGTLTKGVFKLTKVHAIEMEEAQFLQYAAYAESQSNHPIAKSIVKAYGKEIEVNELSGYEEIAGQGIKVNGFGKQILIGNAVLMQSVGIDVPEVESIGTIIHMSLDGVYKGYLVISDEIKETSKQAITELKKLGVSKVVMLTGDHRAVADLVGKELGVDEVYAQLLPHQKVEHVERLIEENSGKGRLVFVGDGMNDAPVLARADIGVAMGGIGSDAAIEAADVVLMHDDPYALVEAIKKSKATNKILWQNIIFAMGVKVLVMALGALGVATMWEAVFADVGVTIIAVINSTRSLKK
ncbi:MAG: heavy metal translocating P-type ATPase [Turicibacter sp.]